MERDEREKIMHQWDTWRKYIAEGGTASWPRDAFENLIDWYEERIRELEAGTKKLNKVVPIGLNLNEAIDWIIARKEDLEEGIESILNQKDLISYAIQKQLKKLVGKEKSNPEDHWTTLHCWWEKEKP